MASAADVEAAVAAAAHRTGIALFPSRKADFDALWAKTVANRPATPGREAGYALGWASADAILHARSADGSNNQSPYIPTNAPGAWRRTPPYFRPPDLPHWAGVRPFSLERAAQFRPSGPPPLDSTRFAADRETTLTLGSLDSTNRTSDQTLAARFWSDFTGTVTPPGHWTQITLALCSSNQVALPEKARLLALVHIALADAGIACWDAKFTWNFWRPVTAAQHRIPVSDHALPNPAWQPLLTTPSFPEYVSGHSTFSGAAAQVLLRWFGRDDLSFSVTSDTTPGVTRRFASIGAAVEEIGRSRIWGGIHFPSADADGQKLGRQVGDWVFDHALRPIRPERKPEP